MKWNWSYIFYISILSKYNKTCKIFNINKSIVWEKADSLMCLKSLPSTIQVQIDSKIREKSMHWKKFILIFLKIHTIRRQSFGKFKLWNKSIIQILSNFMKYSKHKAKSACYYNMPMEVPYLICWRYKENSLNNFLKNMLKIL